MDTNAASSSLTLRLAREVWDRLHAFHLAAGKRKESLSYVWARCERVLGGLVVLIPANAPVHLLGDDCYEHSSGGQVRLRPDVLNGMLIEFARSDYNCLVNIHDHWFAEAAIFSAVDDADDLRFDQYLRSQFEPSLARHPGIGASRSIFNLSVVLGRQTGSARLIDTRARSPLRYAGQATLVDGTWSTASLVSAWKAATSPAPAGWTCRHDGFLPAEAQAKLSRLKVAIVGCGGLGSVLAELLARLGVGTLTLVDADRLETSNLNRVQGALPGEVGAFKARSLAARVKAMVPHCRVRAVTRRLEHARSQFAIASADLVVGALDNDVARYLLNHLALQWLLPYFDLGVLIRVEPEVDFVGRYFSVIPGVTACVECKSYEGGFSLIDRDAVVEHLAHPAITTERRAAGYLAGQPDVATPSAYALNMRTAALGVQEMLNFVAGWRPTATVVHESWNAARLQRADQSNFARSPHPDCPICSLRVGTGRLLPLPSRPSTNSLRSPTALLEVEAPCPPDAAVSTDSSQGAG